MKKILIVASLLLVIFNCKKEGEKVDTGQSTTATPDPLIKEANTFFSSITKVPIDSIPLNKIELGQKLYFDNRLSMNNTISCNSCHDLATYGVDNKALSIGDTKELGSRNSPSVIYAFLHFKQFWDGRAKDVEEQAAGPILNPVEHGIPDEKFLIAKIKEVKEYQDMFKAVYSNDKDPVTFANLTDAIGAFERQLRPVSRFDKYLDGDAEALTQQEKNGLKSFIHDGKCITCHNGVTVGGQMFQKFGLHKNYYADNNIKSTDNGIADLTKDQSDKDFFKVPGLRNITKTGPYLHNGSITDLKQLIKVMGKYQSNVELTDQQVNDIEVFLGSLTAEVDAKYRTGS